MLIDFNTRNETQEQYQNSAEITNKLMLFILEIENILDTDKGEVIGLPDFGMSLELMLHGGYNVGNADVERLLAEQIDLYSEYSKVFDYDIRVEFANTYPRDTLLIFVTVSNGIDTEALQYIYQ